MERFWSKVEEARGNDHAHFSASPGLSVFMSRSLRAGAEVRRDGVEIISGGRRYRWIGPGYGAQLESFEWLRPPAGAQRQITAGGLGSVRFYIFQTRRRGLRVRCSWGVSSSGSLDVHQERIYQARRELFL